MFSPDGALVSQEESERLYGDRPESLQSCGGRIMSRMHRWILRISRIPKSTNLIAGVRGVRRAGRLFVQIFARQPEQMKGMLRAMLVSHRDGSVDHKLKEIIRIQIARFAEDPYFANLRSKEGDGRGSDRRDDRCRVRGL